MLFFKIKVMKFNVFSVINRAPELKLVVETLMSSLKPIGNVVLIAATFFTIFGILGVQVRFGSNMYFLVCLFVFYLFICLMQISILTVIQRQILFVSQCEIYHRNKKQIPMSSKPWGMAEQ